MTLVSTGPLNLSVVDGGPYSIPGLTGPFTTTATSVVVLSTEGLIATPDATVGDSVHVAIRLLVDGRLVISRRYDVERGNFTNSTHWGFTVTVSVAPGPHTVALQAQSSTPGRRVTTNPWPTAVVAGAETSLGQSTLTAVVMNR
jgi:hypothetical protein